MQELIELEATEAIDAARYERIDGRTNERNGHCRSPNGALRLRARTRRSAIFGSRRRPVFLRCALCVPDPAPQGSRAVADTMRFVLMPLNGLPEAPLESSRERGQAGRGQAGRGQAVGAPIGRGRADVDARRARCRVRPVTLSTSALMRRIAARCRPTQLVDGLSRARCATNGAEQIRRGALPCRWRRTSRSDPCRVDAGRQRRNARTPHRWKSLPTCRRSKR